MLVSCTALIVSAPASAQTPLADSPPRDVGAIHAAIAAYLAANIVDTATTIHLLSSHDGVQEANPLLRPLDGSPAALTVMKIGTGAAVSWLLLREHKRHPRATFWIALAGAGAYTAAAISNARLNP